MIIHRNQVLRAGLIQGFGCDLLSMDEKRLDEDKR